MPSVNSEWNRRIFQPAEEPVSFTCHDCGVEQVWKQRGAVPLRCHPCARRAHEETNAHMPYDFKLFGMEGDLCERLPDVLHWSSSLQRWMYFDGNRWCKGYDVDAYKIVLELLRQAGLAQKRKQKRRMFAARGDVENVLKTYQGQCEEAVRVHGGM